MRILIINTDYSKFLQTLYLCRPGLESLSYLEQMRARNESLFGVADFYSKNLRALGHEAEEVQVNIPSLQQMWAREHGISLADPPPPQQGTMHRRRAWNFPLFRQVKPLLRRLARRTGIMGLTHSEKTILRAQIE